MEPKEFEMFVAMHPGRPVKLLVEHLEAADIDPLLPSEGGTKSVSG